MKQGPVFDNFLLQSPPAFFDFFAHVRSLAFEDKPDYAFLIGLFRNIMKCNGWKMDGKYDWIDPGSSPKGTLIPGEYRMQAELASGQHAYTGRWL